MRALTLNLVYHTNIYNNLQIYKTIPLFNSFLKKNLERHFLSSQSYEFTRINLAYSIDKKYFPEANVDKKKRAWWLSHKMYIHVSVSAQNNQMVFRWEKKTRKLAIERKNYLSLFKNLNWILNWISVVKKLVSLVTFNFITDVFSLSFVLFFLISYKFFVFWFLI